MVRPRSRRRRHGTRDGGEAAAPVAHGWVNMKLAGRPAGRTWRQRPGACTVSDACMQGGSQSGERARMCRAPSGPSILSGRAGNRIERTGLFWAVRFDPRPDSARSSMALCGQWWWMGHPESNKWQLNCAPRE